jgi:type 1 fimbria pilin
MNISLYLPGRFLNIKTTCFLSGLTLFIPLCCPATGDVTAIFQSTISSGTCVAQLKSDGAVITNGVLAIGDVYKNELQQGGSGWHNFSVIFSNCQGITSATISPAPGANGVCNQFSFTGSGDLTHAAAEINDNDDGSGSQIICTDTLTKRTIDPNIIADVPYSTRIIISPGKTSRDLKNGSFSAPVAFTIDYQ